MLELLDRIAANPDTDDIGGLINLVRELRPAKSSQVEQASTNVRTLTQLLQGKRSHAIALRHYLMRVLSSRHQTNIYTDTGILPSNGFFSELLQRFFYRMLPPAVDDSYFRDCLDRILPVNTDYVWMTGVPAADWLELFHTLFDAEDGQADATFRKIIVMQLLGAIRILSYRISAMGLEPELIRNLPDLETFESQFLLQNVEVQRYLKEFVRHLDGGPVQVGNTRHLMDMLDQCETVVRKIRNNAMQNGTSVTLTYLLVRISQNIDRLCKLLALVEVQHDLPVLARTGVADFSPRSVAALGLGLELVKAHNRKYAMRELFADNINLLARNVTENASRTGEHYIADNHRQYAAMFRSAAGAGFVIGFMAMLKLFASYLRAAPLVEAFLFSLNYSLGFMLIHVLHFTVATKQPAMTASRIAAELHSCEGRDIDINRLTELIVKVIRTQFVAVLGNILVALPVAYLLALGYFNLQGQQIVSPEKAANLLHDIDPLHSLSLFHAAIAGVCLFVAGLISGYYDNKSAYAHIPARIAQLRWLRRLLGKQRLQGFAAYIGDNLGGLMGNLYFGILLGSIGTLGLMLGLPIDIRHITFAAANFALSLASLENNITWQVALISFAGVLGIGIVNLLVSFSLALFVALRSRQVRFSQRAALLKALLKRFWLEPMNFFVPPNIRSKGNRRIE